MEKELSIIVPDNIKLELSGNTVTLKSGSTVIVPSLGTQYQLTSDMSNTFSTDGKYYIIGATNTNIYNWFSFTSCGSGPTLPAGSGGYAQFFNTTDLKYYTYDNQNNEWVAWRIYQAFLPVGIVSVSGGVVTIDEIFNGFGYIENELFILPEVEGIVPDGFTIENEPIFKTYKTDSLIFVEKQNNNMMLTGSNGIYNSVYFADSRDIYRPASNMFFENGKKILGTPFWQMDFKVQPADISIPYMISQYANSPNFVSLVSSLIAIFDISGTLKDWYNFVLNLKTATGYGLDFWGALLNKDRYFTYLNPDTNQIEVIFLKGAQTVDGVYYSEGEVENLYRTVLFIQAMSYISNCSMNKLNSVLQFYFQDRGMVYVLEYGTMEIRYVFEFFINKLERAIFESAIIPRPTGVLASYEYIPLGAYFGFFVQGKTSTQQPFAPFDQKPFYR